MVLTRDFSEVLANRIQPGAEFAGVQLGEAIATFLNGKPDVAQSVNRRRSSLVQSMMATPQEFAKANM
jgi:hypothetical protein